MGTLWQRASDIAASSHESAVWFLLAHRTELMQDASAQVLLFASALTAEIDHPDVQALAHRAAQQPNAPVELATNALAVLARSPESVSSAIAGLIATYHRHDRLYILDVLWRIATPLPAATQGREQAFLTIWDATQRPDVAVALVQHYRETEQRMRMHDFCCAALTYEHITGVYRAAIVGALGSALKDTGQTRKAAEAFRMAADIGGELHYSSNLMMTLNYTEGINSAQYVEAADRWLLRAGVPALSEARTVLCADQPPLRIGFIGGDFRRHALAVLLLPVFRHLRGEGSDHLIIYSNTPSQDSYTDSFKESVDDFHDIYDKPLADVAELIRRDQLDVLVDVAGHTAHNVLPAFMERLVPVQVGWTSGMMCPPAGTALDYFITPEHSIPLSASVFTERMLSVPLSFGYDTQSAQSGVGRQPHIENGYITFGVLNNPCKIHDDLVDDWVDILTATPKSRLLIKLNPGLQRSAVRKRFAAAGLSDRLTIIGQLPSSTAIQQLYQQRIDIHLDTWPCGGCLTTIESLYAGCPVVTLSGDTFSHRQSEVVIRAVGGMDELVTTCREEYVEAAASLAQDTERLTELRNTLPQAVLASSINRPEETAADVMSAVHTAYRLAGEQLQHTRETLRKELLCHFPQ